MTTPAANPISMTNVLTELRVRTPGRSSVISLGDADVRAMAGVPTGSISLTNCLNKTIYPVLSAVGNNAASAGLSPGGGGSTTKSCTPSVTPSGGSGSRTYLWAFTSNPSGHTLFNSTNQTCRVDALIPNSGAVQQSILSCTVTDATAAEAVTVNNILADFNWTP